MTTFDTFFQYYYLTNHIVLQSSDYNCFIFNSQSPNGPRVIRFIYDVTKQGYVSIEQTLKLTPYQRYQYFQHRRWRSMPHVGYISYISSDLAFLINLTSSPQTYYPGIGWLNNSVLAAYDPSHQSYLTWPVFGAINDLHTCMLGSTNWSDFPMNIQHTYGNLQNFHNKISPAIDNKVNLETRDYLLLQRNPNDTYSLRENLSNLSVCQHHHNRAAAIKYYAKLGRLSDTLFFIKF